jgi:hypothetical protein
MLHHFISYGVIIVIFIAIMTHDINEQLNRSTVAWIFVLAVLWPLTIVAFIAEMLWNSGKNIYKILKGGN